MVYENIEVSINKI